MTCRINVLVFQTVHTSILIDKYQFRVKLRVEAVYSYGLIPEQYVLFNFLHVISMNH
jgi:hypothetical protein